MVSRIWHSNIFKIFRSSFAQTGASCPPVSFASALLARDRLPTSCRWSHLRAQWTKSIPTVSVTSTFSIVKKPLKRIWIKAVHKAIHDKHTDSAQGHGRQAPCLFDEIQDLYKGKCKCWEHTTKKKGGFEPSMCIVGGMNFSFVSTSCKDLSPNNQNRSAGSIIMDGLIDLQRLD